MSIMPEMGDLPTPPTADRKNPIGLRLWSSNNNVSKTSMNVAIVGSRSFEDYARLAKCVAEVLADRRILMSEVQVISGGAVGVDALAERSELSKIGVSGNRKAQV